MTQTQPTLNQVISWAKAAGKIARERFLSEHQYGFKKAQDIVTEVDHLCEDLILREIRENFPTHSILTEESGELNSGSRDCWYIDPLDGTINYAHGVPFYAISIAFEHEGRMLLGVVYDPERDECFTGEHGKGAFMNGIKISPSNHESLGESLLSTGFNFKSIDRFDENVRNFARLTKVSRGVRRLGSAALEFCYVANGRVDAFWELMINAWDIAAGGLIAEEAGAIVTTPAGGAEYFKPPYGFLVSAPGIHTALLQNLNQA